MELKEIIAWIKAKMEECDQNVLFYECCNDDVGVGIFSKNYTRYKKIFELLKELQELKAQPEIIHCCECKFFRANMSPDGYIPKGAFEFECKHWNGSCDPTDFCSYGERKGGG